MLKEKEKEKYQTFKPVIKMKEMDNEMLKFIEGFAKESFEDVKVKFKDEMVKIQFLILFRK
jgi:hypothetical protein